MILPHRESLAMSGDIFGYYKQGRGIGTGMQWVVGCCQMFYNAQDSPAQRISWSRMLVVLRLRNLGKSTESKWEIRLGLLVPSFPETGSLELSKHI